MKPFKIYAEFVEQAALDQFHDAMAQPFVVRGALMPDAHAGYSLPIGAVVATDNFVVPSWVGYDIGCGMCAVKTTFGLAKIKKNARAIFDSIYTAIPTGFAHNAKETAWQEADRLPTTQATREIFDKNGLRQLGSLGSGNHFIEVGVDERHDVWVVIHSGSRGIGHAVASHYMRKASPDGKPREGHFGFVADSQDGRDYITDVKFCLEFALKNRLTMIERVVEVLSRYSNGGAEWYTLINRNHNHVELRDGMWIHRKGATHAEDGMGGVIPGNMLDGSFIVTGKGNTDALWSSSHGAGRVLGRKEAKRVLDLGEFEATMRGVTAKVDDSTLDESPLAYKDIHEVMRQQVDLVEVVAHVKPIINIKA